MMFRIIILACALLAASRCANAAPNILWIMCEDISPNLGCYGDPDANTPNLDAFAQRGMKFVHVWSNAPVCAPAKSAIITGMYPTSLGAQHMRSEVEIPGFLKLYPELLQQAGYYCTNHSKTDYNVVARNEVWNETSNKAHWKDRKPGQPFFAVFDEAGTHEGKILAQSPPLKHDPKKIHVPPYHPDTPEVRRDWARYHDNISSMDERVGKYLRELDEAGLAEDTIVFFFSDHGSGMPRSKRSPYNSGLQVPMIVYVPQKWQRLAPKGYQAGATSERLVSFVDLAPTLLSIANVNPPEWMDGRAFMGSHPAEPSRYLHGFRGRMDERYDCIRSVTDGRYVYLRNYLPQLVYGQHVRTMFQTPTTQVWKKLFDEGKLNEAQSHFWQRKPTEELYDLQLDPHETKNLASEPGHQSVLKQFRAAQREQVVMIRDVGLLTEAEMHRRAIASGKTIYEMGRDPHVYPLDRILQAAELASSRDAPVLRPMVDLMQDRDPAVRYWGAMGLLIRGKDAVVANRQALVTALADENASVRIAAAEALGKFGNDDEVRRAVETLGTLAVPDESSQYVALAALNVIDGLGEKATELVPTIKKIPLKTPGLSARVNGYCGRLREHILANLYKPN